MMVATLRMTSIHKFILYSASLNSTISSQGSFFVPVGLNSCLSS